MKIITILLIALTAFLTGNELHAMNLELQATKRGLKITLTNDSPQEVKVNKRFAYGSPGAWAELSFVIQDSKGETFEYQKKTKIGPPNERDWCYLSLGQFVGKEIPMEEIKSSYGLVSGRFRVRVKYTAKGDDGGFSGELESTPVDVVLKE